VAVDGTVVVRDRTLLRLDIHQIRAQANEAAARLFR
jgi:hypothetical protein